MITSKTNNPIFLSRKTKKRYKNSFKIFEISEVNAKKSPKF